MRWQRLIFRYGSCGGLLVKRTTDGGTINEKSTEKLCDPSYGIGPFNEDGEDYE